MPVRCFQVILDSNVKNYELIILLSLPVDQSLNFLTQTLSNLI